uniref:Uncharacterized protein n=1 Tax=Helianthus annuus TaxID=4232 RepID=A0A251SAN1_HELAN
MYSSPEIAGLEILGGLLLLGISMQMRLRRQWTSLTSRKLGRQYLLNNYLILFDPPVDPFQLLVIFIITLYLKLSAGTTRTRLAVS